MGSKSYQPQNLSMDCLSFDALVQFIYGDKLAGAMRNADVARAKYNSSAPRAIMLGASVPNTHSDVFLEACSETARVLMRVISKLSSIALPQCHTRNWDASLKFRRQLS